MTTAEPAGTHTQATTSVAERCDTSILCWNCGDQMKPEHAHYRCASCGWRDSCCDGPS